MFKDPLEVRIQHETYRTMSATYVQAILSRKKFDRVGGGAHIASYSVEQSN